MQGKSAKSPLAIDPAALPKRISRRQALRGVALSGAALMAAAFVSCGGKEQLKETTVAPDSGQDRTLEQRLYEAAKKEGKVVWWATINIDDAASYIKAFEEKYRGIKVEYFEGMTAIITEKLLLEHQAGRVSADVFVSTQYAAVRDAGVLADLSDLIEPPTYPSELFLPAKDGAYYQYVVNTIMYNTNRVRTAEAPRSWEDLLQPRWKGRIGLWRRPLAFVYGTEIPEYQGKVQGLWSEERMVDYLMRLRAQTPGFEPGNSVVMTKLLAGEYDVAVGYLHQILAEQKAGAPVDMAPVDRVFVNPSSAFVSKYAPHPNAARLLLRWWIGPEGNKLAEQLRPAGNPLPGSGTVPARFLEQKGSRPILTTIDIEEHLERLERRYQRALGLPTS